MRPQQNIRVFASTTKYKEIDNKIDHTWSEEAKHLRLGGWTRTRCLATLHCTGPDLGTKVFIIAVVIIIAIIIIIIVIDFVIVIIVIIIVIVIRQLHMQSSGRAGSSWVPHGQSSHPGLRASSRRAQRVGSIHII